MRNCKNCGWYCHRDGNCYVPKDMADFRLIPFNPNFGSCQDWTFDGLADWERKDCEEVKA